MGKRINEFTPGIPEVFSICERYLNISKEYEETNQLGRSLKKKGWHPSMIHDEGLDLVKKVLDLEPARRAKIDPALAEGIYNNILTSGLSVITDIISVKCFIYWKQKKKVSELIEDISDAVKEFNNGAYNPFDLDSLTHQLWEFEKTVG